jgi:predicted aspartyl protease
MKQFLRLVFLTICLNLIVTSVSAQQFQTTVPMRDRGAATYYVPSEITGVGAVELMVDTGSGYMTINQQTLTTLLNRGEALYVRQLEAMLADGKRTVVPVYSLSAINIGGNCWLKNVEAAVFPGKTRQILGLSALKKASPFIFSFDPPQLVLSYCTGSTAGEPPA